MLYDWHGYHAFMGLTLAKKRIGKNNKGGMKPTPRSQNGSADRSDIDREKVRVHITCLMFERQTVTYFDILIRQSSVAEDPPGRYGATNI
jgi:hypothetical protein